MKQVDFPLAAFLLELEAEDPAFRLTVRDYGRIHAAMASGGHWNLSRLRHTLGALLVRDMVKWNMSYCCSNK